MSDRFFPLDPAHLLELMISELDATNSLLGIPGPMFFAADKHRGLHRKVFGHGIDTPLGVAAGPHTQLSQNIIAAWLVGARYIELKTVQTLDELDVAKPCIDMQDEGYNCEWSQELTIRQSFSEYLNAWAIIHLLHHRMKGKGDPGVVFNMSVGYDLRGIMQENVQWFLSKMADCGPELEKLKETLRPIAPDILEVDIPSRISDNITLSTMHGCPAAEIGSIARYLMEEKRLHTLVKLNPTLLGPAKLREILNERLGFGASVPDQAFEHDLKLADARSMIRSLQATSAKAKLDFGLKLTNTLETENNKEVFGPGVQRMYMSGRALHPLSVTLAARLQQDFNGGLHLSFSGGADAFNVVELLASGFASVTVCTDLLKPGGYMRLPQYIENIEKEMLARGLSNVDELSGITKDREGRPQTALDRLIRYAGRVVDYRAYRKDSLSTPDIRTERKLGPFDCISAPCRETCATAQDIPEYLFHASGKDFKKAHEVILRTNPFPAVTGMVCDHLCQGKCTRVHYDDPLLIREVKRFVSELPVPLPLPAKANGLRVGIVGAGPAGLSCAYFLALAGFRVEVLESRSKAGGMIRYAIPGFRLTESAIESDLDRLEKLGVAIRYNCRVDAALFGQLKKDHDYLFVAPGAQVSAPPGLEGIEARGVLDPLTFLFDAKKGVSAGIGKQVVIIGGGNTAMDAARTAWRLVGKQGKVRIVYRRRIEDMPADQGEIRAVLEEGMEIIEWAGPEKVVSDRGRVSGLLCSKMEAGETDVSGRPAPKKIAGSEFEIPCDTLIPAIGQWLDVDFMEAALLQKPANGYETRLKKVFTGGDAMRGASTAINAIGDGKKAARQIIESSGLDFCFPFPLNGKAHSRQQLMIKRGQRAFAPPLNENPPEKRQDFSLVQQSLDEDSIVNEAARCLHCDEICNICTTVCPNLANIAYPTQAVSHSMVKLVREEGDRIGQQPDGRFELSQGVQILNIANFCNECGNCRTFCPTSGAPYKDKPRLHLSMASFQGSESGYYLVRLQDRDNLIHKQNGRFRTLTETALDYVYETDFVVASFEKKAFTLKQARLLTPCVKEAGFHEAAAMRVLMDAGRKLLPGQKNHSFNLIQ